MTYITCYEAKTIPEEACRPATVNKRLFRFVLSCYALSLSDAMNAIGDSLYTAVTFVLVPMGGEWGNSGPAWRFLKLRRPAAPATPAGARSSERVPLINRKNLYRTLTRGIKYLRVRGSMP